MACRRHSLNKPKNIKIAYILPTNRVTDQSPAPLSNVKSIKKPWKHWTERRQKSCVDYWLCRNRNRQYGRGLYACPHWDYRPYRGLRPHFAGSLWTAEWRCHARPRNDLCPAQRKPAIRSLLLSKRLYGYGAVQRQMDGRRCFAEPSLAGRPHDIR